MNRPAWQEIWMGLALKLSERSTCKRLSVGCIITSTDFSEVFGIGYNGNAKKLPNTCDRDEPGNCGCLHAEDNAVTQTNEPKYVKKIVFSTHQPCANCAKRFINKEGIIKIYYLEPYRLREGLEILEKVGVEMIHYKFPKQDVS